MKKIVALAITMVLMAALLSVGGFAAQDTTPPVITKVEAESVTVSEDETFTITVHASDDSGFPENHPGAVQIIRLKNSPEENEPYFVTELSSNGDGSFTATFHVWDAVPAGDYVLDYVSVTDKSGNKTKITSDKDPNKLFPDAKFTIKTSRTDVISPSIDKVEAKSQTLKPGDQFTVTVYASDDKGLLEDDSSIRAQVALVHADDENSTEGNTLKTAPLVMQGNGKLTATFTVGDDWKPGEYAIRHVDVEDKAGNIGEIQNYWGDEPMLANYVFTVVDKNASSAPPRRPFEDVPVDTWYTGAVKYVTNRGYMSGTGDYKFSPDATVTRGMIAQILYAAEGKPTVSGVPKFSDVKAGKWYADAVNWAASKGLVSGVGNGQFMPESPITREQMVAILYKYAQMKEFDLSATADLSKYPDQAKISNWAVTAVKWGVDHGIISGTNNGIEPQGNATRAQIAVILRGFDINVRV